MRRTGTQRASSRRSPLGRTALCVLAAVGLSALAITPGMASAATPAAATTDGVVSTAKDAKLGTVLVTGTTVYTLKASKTACTAQCLKAWPPVLLPQGMTAATAGDGVDGAKLGTTPAAGGALQITYAGKPLYWFVKDTAPGQVHGNVTNKWGKWSAVVTAKSSSGAKAPDTTNAGTGGAAF